MKKLCLILVLVFFGCFNNAFAQTMELKFVCENKEDFPNVIGNSQSIDWKMPGASVEALKLLEKKLNVKVNVYRAPWKQALENDVKEGIADGIIPISYKKERAVFGVYPMKDGTPDDKKSLFSQSYNFYRLKKSNIDWDGKELRNFKGKIGAPKGYSIVDDLRKLGYDVEESDGTLTDMKKLIAGKIQAVAAMSLSGNHLLKTNPDLNNSIEKVERVISTKVYFLMLSNQFVKKNPQMAEKIWDALGEIRNKEFVEMALKYFKTGT